MKTYNKTHHSEKALNTHKDRIEKRGGTHKVKQEGELYIITYQFPNKKKS